VLSGEQLVVARCKQKVSAFPDQPRSGTTSPPNKNVTAMNRRSATTASTHLPHGPRRTIADPAASESSFSRFMREQVFAPDKIAGNLSILTAVSLFSGGIVVARVWGDLLIPA
jgi:hypothetical protein